MAQAKTATKEVATKKEAGLPAEFMDELALAGEEHKEALGKDDMSIPFLQILQSLSPQCTKGEPEFIKGSEPSDLLNTVTQTIIKTRDDDDNAIAGCRVLPISYKRSFIEWVPRSQGGGIVNEYSVEDGLSIITQRSAETGQDIIQANSPLGTPGNQLNDTHTHFMFLLNDDGTHEPVVLTMASTQIKPSKDLNNMVSKQVLPDGRKAPRFFGIYDVTTVRRSNDQGSWYIWKFERATDVLTDDKMGMFREAKEFVAGIESGEHKADHSKAEGEVNPKTADTSGASGDNDDEVPF